MNLGSDRPPLVFFVFDVSGGVLCVWGMHRCTCIYECVSFCMHIWTSEGNVGCLFLSFPTLVFEVKSFTGPKTHCFSSTGWLESLRDLHCAHPPLWLREHAPTPRWGSELRSHAVQQALYFLSHLFQALIGKS